MKKKEERNKIKGGWGNYFGKRSKNSDRRKVRGKKDKNPHGMLELRRMLGWELRISERTIFRSCCYPCGEC